MSRHDHIHGQFAFGFAQTISTAQAAKRLKMSSETVRKLLQEGKLSGYRLRPHSAKSPWLVFKLSVDKYIDRVNRAYGLGDYAEESNSTKAAKPASGARG